MKAAIGSLGRLERGFTLTAGKKYLAGAIDVQHNTCQPFRSQHAEALIPPIGVLNVTVCKLFVP
jgi:hypothetical protein